MDVVQQKRNALPQMHWPVRIIETGSATVAAARGIERLARVPTSKNNSASAPKTRAHAPDADVRLEKVERLRAALAEGTYRVSAEALAEKMIEHMHEVDLLDRKKD